MAEMLAVAADAAALLHPVVFRQRQRGFSDHTRNGLQPLRLEARGIDRNAGVDQSALDVIDGKHFAGESPEIVDRCLRATVALFGAIAEAHDPLAGMAQMIS